jgi:hypothetical protein
VPDKRKHRGPHPGDAGLFGPEALPVLCQAGEDLAWLLGKGYASTSALKLVGDRYGLVARQRTAVARATCSAPEAAGRREREVGPEQAAGRTIWLDGYNVLTTVEAALSGGVILGCRDRTYRDMASMHGSYRKVAETRPALERIGRTLVELSVGECRWYLDRPVSNSGRLKAIIEQLAGEEDWPWQVELVPNPDPVLWEADQIVATADSVILDRCARWVNLARWVIDRRVRGTWIVRLAES